MKVTLLLLAGSLAAAQVEQSGCRALRGDASWPADAVWKSALPGVTAHDPQADIKRPDYRFDAKSADDVVKAVKFAAQNNVRLSILNSGHDFLGRADAPSGLLLSVGNLKGIRVLPSFIPSTRGAQSAIGATANTIKPTAGRQAAVTIGAGVTTQELNNALEASGLFTIGAAHGSVAVVGGYSQAAGHAPLSHKYGLGADQVLEYKVVTADGQLRVANRFTNSDLFWALRGGGGGTFGVVVEATIKAHPSPKISLLAFFLNTTNYNDHKSIYQPLAYMHQQFKSLNEKGNAGYYFMFNNAVKGTFINPDLSPSAMNQTWQPVLQRMANMPGINPKTLVVSTKEFANFKQFYDGAFGALEGGHDHGSTGTDAGGHDHGSTGGSDMGGHDHGTPEPSQPAAGGHDHGADTGSGGHDHGTPTTVVTQTNAPAAAGGHDHGSSSGGHAHRMRGEMPMEPRMAAPEPVTEDFAPGFLKQFFRRHGDEPMDGAMGIVPLDSRLLGVQEMSSPRLADALEKSMPKLEAGQIRGHLIAGGKVLTQGRDTSVLPAWRKAYVHLIGTGKGFPDVSALKALGASMGAYSNEASTKEPNWKQTFWGSNYNRLSQIKTKYDPNNVFWVTPGINADHMVVNNGRLCKATAPSTSLTPPENDNKNYATQSGGHDDGDGAPFPILYQGP